MKHPMKRALAALFSLLLVVSAALALPLVMDQVMKGSLTTQVVFAQEEAPTPLPSPTPLPMATPDPEVTPQEEDNPLPTPIPVVTPIQDAGWGFILPTPMPAAGPSAMSSLAQPLPWRKLLEPMAAEGAQMWADKLNTLTIAGGDVRVPDTLVASYYLLPNNGPHLVEALLPKEPSLQKLLQGILLNLDSQPIFVPDQAVLERVLTLPIAALLLPEDGQHSLFLATGAQRLPLAVLDALASQGKKTAAYSEYTNQRDLMVAEAQALISTDPDTAMDKSAALVAQLMKGDAPWQLAIIQMTPYSCNAAWDYYLAGHHVKAVDMESGEQVTLTTDLISGKVVGFTREDGELFLATYQKLLLMAEQMADLAPDELAKAQQAATVLASELAGIPLDEGKWQAATAGVIGVQDGIPAAQWETQFNHADEESQLLDPSGTGLPMEYRIKLNQNLQLVSWDAFPLPQRSSGQGLGFDDKNFEVSLAALLQAHYQDRPEIITRVNNIVQNRDKHFSDMQQKVGRIFPGVMLKDPGQIMMDDLTFQDGTTITQVSFIATFITPVGKTLSVTALVDEAGQVQISHLAQLDPSPAPATPQDREDAAIKAAILLGSDLADSDLSDTRKWQPSFHPGIDFRTQAMHWTVVFEQLDPARPDSAPFASCQVVMDDDLRFIAWNTRGGLAIKSNIDGYSVHFDAPDFEGNMERLLQTYFPQDEQTISRVRQAAGNRQAISEQALAKAQAYIPGAALTGSELHWEHLTLTDGSPLIDIFISLDINDARGNAYWVKASQRDDGTVQIDVLNNLTALGLVD